jgi:hypothetical protein
MPRGIPPEHAFTPQLPPRGKRQLASLLARSGAGKEVIDAWRIQEPLQDGSGHDTEGSRLDDGGKDRVE